MRTLLLLRHAKSDRTQPVMEDFERPLNERGRDAAERVGRWMKQHHLQPEWVICSSAVRTRETLTLMRHHLAVPDTLVDFNDQVYLAELQALLQALTTCPQDASNVLMVGHNPGMEELLSYLCGESLPLSTKGKLMPTATLAQVDLPDDWRSLSERSGKLAQIVRPGELA